MKSKGRPKYRCQICNARVLAASAAAWASIYSTNCVYAAPVPTTPEQETLRVSKMLKPIPNAQWESIAGDRISGKYEITPGDSLFAISKRLFGDARYWPKIWALNNNAILNPHQIRPGYHIAFMPGTGTDLPSVAVESNSGPSLGDDNTEHMNDAGAPIQMPRKGRSQEWRDLPVQNWEGSKLEQEAAAQQSQVITVMSDLRKEKRPVTHRDLPAFITSQKIPPLGTLLSSPHPNAYLRPGDSILIKARDLTVGNSYTVVGSPEVLERYQKKSVGFAYPVAGEVKVISENDGVYTGVMTHVQGFVARGFSVIPLRPRLKIERPIIAAPEVMEGRLYLDHSSATFLTGPGGFGFVNLGSENGVAEGMIFRSYEVRDSISGARLPRPDQFPICDLQVVQVSEHFSSLQVISGTSVIMEGTPLFSVTDIEALKAQNAVTQRELDLDSGLSPEPAESPQPTEAPPKAPEIVTPPKNPLDDLDEDDQMTPEEKKELLQIERHKDENKDKMSTAPETAPKTEPSTPPEPTTTSTPVEPAKPETLPKPEVLEGQSVPATEPEAGAATTPEASPATPSEAAPAAPTEAAPPVRAPLETPTPAALPPSEPAQVVD